MKQLLMLALLCILLSGSVFALTINSGNPIQLGDEDTVRSNPEHDDDDLQIQRVSTTVSIDDVAGVSGLNATFQPASGFTSQELNVSLSISGTQLTISANVPEDLDAISASFVEEAQHIGTVTVTGSSSSGAVTASAPVRMQAENGLVIDDIDVIIDGDDYSCDVDNNNDCDDEVQEVRPGAEVSIVVTIANLFDEDSNLDLEDVSVSIDSDNSDIDFDDDDIEIDVDADSEEEITFDLDIDEDVEDGDSATITIEVEGSPDGSTARYGMRYRFDLEFELGEGEVEIADFTVTPAEICAGDEATVNFALVNEGSDRQTGVRFQIENDRLGVNRIFTGITLDDAEEDEDAEYEDSHDITTRLSTTPGTYVLRGTVFFEDEDNDDTSTFLNTNLVVRDCRTPSNGTTGSNQSGSQQNSTIVVTQPPVTSGGVVSGGPVAAQPIDEVEGAQSVWITTLVILLIVLALVVIYLIVALARKD